MIGGDLPSSATETISLLTNADVLEVRRSSSGNREVFREDPLVLWAADGPGETRYAGAFNLGGEPLSLALDVENVGFPVSRDARVQDLWTGKELPLRAVTEQSDAARGVAPGSAALDLTLAPHGAALLRYSVTE